MAKKTRYRVLVGLQHGEDDCRHEAGEIVDHLPRASIPWLLEQQLIEEVADADPAD